MKNLKYLFGILSICVLLFNISCQRTVTNSVVEKLRIDTIRDYKVITKYDAVHDTTVIENPCDSAGILTTFYSKITLPQGKIIIRSYRGKIQATVNIDSIRSVYEKKYRYMETSNVTNSAKIVTKVTYPSWLVTAFILESLLIIGFLYFKYIFGR
jgi:hypothetical protein